MLMAPAKFHVQRNTIFHPLSLRGYVKLQGCTTVYSTAKCTPGNCFLCLCLFFVLITELRACQGTSPECPQSNTSGCNDKQSMKPVAQCQMTTNLRVCVCVCHPLTNYFYPQGTCRNIQLSRMCTIIASCQRTLVPQTIPKLTTKETSHQWRS